jgi:hypothetical protein
MLTEYWEAWKEKGLFITRPLWIPGTLPVILLISLYLLINPSLSMSRVPTFALWTPSSFFPTGAVDWIKARDMQGRILPHFDWGEFITWSCYPACLVAMDGRYETVYEDPVAQEYFDFLAGRAGWDVFLRKYPHDMVLVRYKSRTHLLMLKEPSWRLVYADRLCVLFLRNENRAVGTVSP